jgi:hypothetical protein
MRDQCIGLVTDVGRVAAEQLRFDAVESRNCVGPRVDGFIQFGDEAAGEHFRALPADPRVDPGLSGAGKILLVQPVTQIARSGQRPADVLDHRLPIPFHGFVEWLATCGGNRHGQQHDAQRGQPHCGPNTRGKCKRVQLFLASKGKPSSIMSCVNSIRQSDEGLITVLRACASPVSPRRRCRVRIDGKAATPGHRQKATLAS